MTKRWSVVLPTNRPERLKDFLDAWDIYFTRHVETLYIVQDLPDHATETVAAAKHRSYRIEVDRWPSITPERIPTRTDMVRSWGIWRAWKEGGDFTLTLDDDTAPHPGADVFREYEAAFDRGAPLSPYLDVGALTSSGLQMRGFPFGHRKPVEVAVQYGGWNGVLDYDAPTQLAGVGAHEKFARIVMPVPKGAAVTGCIMNCAWRTRYAPLMWQLPLLGGRYNRFGDIWSGLFQKKALDLLGVAMVVNGRAAVQHERASDPVANLAREAPGIPINETLWDHLWGEVGTVQYVYRRVTDSARDYFASVDLDYARHFSLARDEWLDLFRQ